MRHHQYPNNLIQFQFLSMKFSLLQVVTLLSLAVVGSHGAMTPEVYWKSVLPNTTMPNSIKELLDTTGVGDNGLSENTREPRGGRDMRAGPRGGRTKVDIGGGGVGVHYGNNGSIGVHPGPNPFMYNYAASKDQLNDDPNTALFFLEKDLHKGKEMNLHFTKTEDQKSMFLPREVADSIPFSSDKLPQIYDEFSVKPGSLEAEIMNQTVNECENKGIEGEEKYCATSLESMVDFSTKNLGNKVKAVSTDANESSPLQKYKIEDVKRMNGAKAVVCHKQDYVYAVFYCHKTFATRAYVVSMVGEDDSRVKAVAVCHTDTAKWNPKHLAFQVLKVKPGTIPVCHFLPEDHVVWVPY